MSERVLALEKDLKTISWCSAEPDNRGKRRCQHIAHQNPGESNKDFIKRIENLEKDLKSKDESEQEALADAFNGSKEISQEDINDLASQLDSIAGERLTVDNFEKVISKLDPQQISDIAKICFENAPKFSLPISDEEYDNENIKNKLYFANLPKYGLGKQDALNQMFVSIGKTYVEDGKIIEINNNYRNGLTPEEYFNRQFIARSASISKGLGTSKPGYVARKAFYALSDTIVVDDCGGEHIDALHCSMPEGNICLKCARKTRGGNADIIKVGNKIGGWLSTNLSEALTQLSMSQKHTGTMETENQMDSARTVMSTLDGWSTSPIVKRMTEAKTTEEARKICFEGLKEAYSSANIVEDDINLQMIARKLTSYKRDKFGLRPVEPDEKCDIVSIASIGNKNNIFKHAELESGYKSLTKPLKQDIKPDSVNDILR